MTLNIVMVEPQIPQNTGNVARTCAATGTRLHLVGPMGFVVDDRKLKRAGLDYWHLLDISYYEDLADFFRQTMGEGAVDACANAENPCAPDTSAYNYHYFTTKARHTYTQPRYEDNSYIFFGSETRGLPEDLLRRNEAQCVRLPLRSEARSLNLSNAVAVGVFEVLRQWDFPDLEKAKETLV